MPRVQKTFLGQEVSQCDKRMSSTSRDVSNSSSNYCCVHNYYYRVYLYWFQRRRIAVVFNAGGLLLFTSWASLKMQQQEQICKHIATCATRDQVSRVVQPGHALARNTNMIHGRFLLQHLRSPSLLFFAYVAGRNLLCGVSFWLLFFHITYG